MIRTYCILLRFYRSGSEDVIVKSLRKAAAGDTRADLAQDTDCSESQGSCQGSCQVHRPEAPELAETAKVAHFVASFAKELRQMLAASKEELKGVEELVPLRRAAAERLVATEKALRRLDRDLKSVDESLFPLSEESQSEVCRCISQAQLSSKEALSEFVQLPQQLKKLFDLTKRLRL